jgi:hypothetical protein
MKLLSGKRKVKVYLPSLNDRTQSSKFLPQYFETLNEVGDNIGGN